MLRCVTTYNNLVTRIADKHGLRSLEHMIVRKAPIDQPSRTPSRNNVSSNSSKPTSVQHKTGRPAESGATADGNLKLKATLERGEGRYTKGLFNKKGMVNFKLKVSIQNQEGLKISSITASLKGKGMSLESGFLSSELHLLLGRLPLMEWTLSQTSCSIMAGCKPSNTR